MLHNKAYSGAALIKQENRAPTRESRWRQFSIWWSEPVKIIITQVYEFWV